MQKENTLTVGQWCGQWFTANRHKWNGNTEGGYRNLIYSHILPSIGSMELSDLTEQTITDFYDSLQNRGLSARSVWCVHLLLRRCMDEAAREQFIPYNPVRLCQESKAEGYKAAPLRLGQLQRYLNATEQLGVLPLIYTGLKEALEIVGLQGREKDKALVLSGGEKQRLGIARAILKNASVTLHQAQSARRA